MLFNSLQFFIFFVIVYSLYLASDHRRQNRLLLIASYIFYGAWDVRFLSLIWISTILDYFCAIKIRESGDTGKKKLFLFLSVFGNLSILGFFKYFNFFVANLKNLTAQFGLSLDPPFLNIILPLGISFYTFQTLSYTIDVYRGRMEPTKRFFDFALFVAFFPQLVAGPIERAKHLLPQVLNRRILKMDRFYEGCYLIGWGLFMKVFIADNLAKIVDPVFAGSSANSIKTMIALYAFSFQIFCDFAGYSNIARGLGRLMGFDIMVNFRLPYFAKNPREFWQRWHISLSTWLRDYLYIPLGGNRRGMAITYRNLGITMLLGGLWHGAKWTFVVWGLYHGLLLVLHRAFRPLLKKIPSPRSRFSRNILSFVQIIFFFNVVSLGWLFFRAQSLSQAASMLGGLFSGFGAMLDPAAISSAVKLLFFIALLLAIQVVQCLRKDLFVVLKLRAGWQVCIYLAIAYSLLLFGVTTSEEFIYFQF